MARSRKRNETFEPESRWSRVIWIDRQIRDGQPPGVEEIMEQFGVKKNTVDATIRFMRDSLGAPIVHKRLPRPHYCYTDSTYALPTVFLVEGELLALLLSEQILHHYVGTPLEAGLKSAVSKLTRYLPDTIKLRMQDVSDTIRFTGLPPRDVSLEVLNALSRAINERCLVRILYH
ncbi:MAG: hypothetical protein FJX76_23970, partial [Armatimonadetes bacterium]|nr:hypothetical protein [Armatimonadota bacterium]